MTTPPMSVARAFHEFLRALEITPTQRKRADQQKAHVRDALSARLKLDDVFVAGSFGRRTAIRPLDDIDLFIVLNEHVHRNLRSPPIRRCLDEVLRALQAAYPGQVSMRPQRRSVNVTFQSTGIGYDVVPAFQVQGKRDHYIIPDVELQSWISTNPKRHAEICKQADARAGNVLKQLIKAAKHWNATHGKHIGSFHLEVMSYDALHQPPPSLVEGFQQLLAHLAGAIREQCHDPADVKGPRIDRSLKPERRQQLSRQLQNAANKVQRAIELDRQDRPATVAEAHQILRKLLGNMYPGR